MTFVYFSRIGLRSRTRGCVNPLCSIFCFFFAVIVVVVGVREIYTNVEKENTKNERNCLGFSDVKNKIDEANEHEVEFLQFKEESSISNPDYDNVTLCYIFDTAGASRDCINLGGSLNSGSIYSKCVEFQNPGLCGLTGGWECAVDVGQDFTEIRVKDSCAGQTIDIFATQKVSSDATYSGISKEHLLQYILGGIVAGILVLTLIIFVTLKLVIPKLCPRNPTATRVLRNLGAPVTINERNSDLPGLADLPPEYGDIDNYPKDDPLPERPPGPSQFTNAAFTPDSHPETYLSPPQYSEINR